MCKRLTQYNPLYHVRLVNVVVKNDVDMQTDFFPQPQAAKKTTGSYIERNLEVLTQIIAKDHRLARQHSAWDLAKLNEMRNLTSIKWK